MKKTAFESVNIYKRLLKYAMPSWPKLTGAVLCMVGYAIFNGFVSAAIYVVFNGFTNHGKVVIEKIPQFHLQHPIEIPLFAIPIVLVTVFILRGLFEFGSNYLMGSVGLKAIMQIRNELQAHIVRLSMDFFSRRRTGELMSRVLNDVGTIQNAISSVLVDLTREPLVILFNIPWIFFWGGNLAWFGLIAFPIVIVPIAMFGKKIKKITHRTNESTADIHSVLHESLAGIRVVKSFNMENHEIQKFSNTNKSLFKYYMRTLQANEITRPIIEVLGAFGVGLAVWYGMEKMEPSHFVAFIGALFVMYEPVKKLSRVHNTIQQALASGERIFEILDAKTTVMEAPRPEILTRNIQEVVFEHVYFNYGDTPILKDIDIHVKRGEILAIVGSSGSGKTTLVNLIPRFYDPLRGRVLINGISVSEYSFTSLRDQIGIVWQETFLFNSTIRENISYGKSSASFEEIKRAAEAAYADDFIRLLPNGYDTVVGERGAALSGGERQRIAIARALLKDPPILILDEATSQLDTESEREVQKALDRLMEGRTVFVIAHRLSTVQRADRIIVLEEGQIVQDGKHDSLVSKSGRYKELYELQFSV